MTKIKIGDLESFFEAAKETARKIDKGLPITPSSTIWITAEDAKKLKIPNPENS